MADLIDRRAAIKAIENLQDCYNGFSDTYDKACIIGVIEEIPTAQPNTPTDTPTDLISRQAAIDTLNGQISVTGDINAKAVQNYIRMVNQRLHDLPSAQPEIVRCKDCKWWDKKEDSPLGYCHAAKHCHYSRHWEIQIYRTYPADFYCADGERRSENDGN